MTVARASRSLGNLGRTVLRRPGFQSRTQAWRQVTRRNYASEHGQKSSELPWMIGSVVVTVPAAMWLLQQGPSKGDHGHGESHDEQEESKEEAAPESQEESKEDDAPAEDSKDEKPAKEEKSDDKKSDAKTEKKDDKKSDAKTEKKDDKKDEKKDQSKDKSDNSGSDGGDSDSGDEGDKKDTPSTSDDSDSDDGQYEKPGPNAPGQINYKPGLGKGPGEGQKGPRSPTEKKGEKDSAKDYSGAKHPALNDPEKSKKGEGITETAKIHGTVDSRREGR